jgi:hypothetical protein
MGTDLGNSRVHSCNALYDRLQIQPSMNPPVRVWQTPCCWSLPGSQDIRLYWEIQICTNGEENSVCSIFHANGCKRTKHINSQFHWVREKVQAGRFEVEICHTEEQTANVLTKALPHPKHERHTKEMGLSPV